jgi:hypothetical protein
MSIAIDKVAGGRGYRLRCARLQQPVWSTTLEGLLRKAAQELGIVEQRADLDLRGTFQAARFIEELMGTAETGGQIGEGMICS